jgi:hypothetical protein
VLSEPQSSHTISLRNFSPGLEQPGFHATADYRERALCIVRYHDRIVCALAGEQAQRRVTPQSVRSRDANGDEAIAAELLLRLHGEERERNCAFKYLEAKAPNLVSHHWRTVEELAEKMLNYQSIAGKEVANILRASRLAQMHENPAA